MSPEPEARMLFALSISRRRNLKAKCVVLIVGKLREDILDHGRHRTIRKRWRAPKRIRATEDEGSRASPARTTVEFEAKAGASLWETLRGDDVGKWNEVHTDELSCVRSEGGERGRRVDELVAESSEPVQESKRS